MSSACAAASPPRKWKFGCRNASSQSITGAPPPRMAPGSSESLDESERQSEQTIALRDLILTCHDDRLQRPRIDAESRRERVRLEPPQAVDAQRLEALVAARVAAVDPAARPD